MRCIALLLVAVAICAVEVKGTVKSVTDGDTIAVTLSDGVDAKVRLLHLDTPESRDNSHGEAMPEGKAASAFLRDLLPVGSAVVLAGPGDKLEADRYQRLLAIVVLPDGGTAQERIIRAGWSVYWRKYGEAAAYHERLLAAHEAAKTASTGAWATIPQWMVDKSNERTSPKR